MSERSLEDRLFDAVVEWARKEMGGMGQGSAPLALAISTALTLAERNGYARRAEEGYTGEEPAVLAAVAFPLPTRNVRQLREEPDPHGVGVTCRFLPETAVESDEFADGDGGLHVHGGACPFPTPERIALWYGLMQNPWSEEQAPVDPNEVLPP